MPLLRRAVRGTMGVATAIKDLNRLRAIATVLARHGLGVLVENVSGLEGLRRGTEDHSRPLPERMVAVCEELGPTFIKLGQFVSTRPDLVPAEIALAFERLQSDALPVPLPLVRKEIERGLGTGIEVAFQRFDDKPLATASIAQVHRAWTEDGDAVAVKVLRPGVRRVVETDLSILGFLARQAEGSFPELAVVDLSGILAEFRRALWAETDLRMEARNLERFGRAFAENEAICFPRVFPARSSASVLTMGFLDGVPLRQAQMGEDERRLVATNFLDASFQMLMKDGFFHGDLHPGNVLYLGDGRLGLLDVGMVGTLSPTMRDHLVTLLFAVSRNDVRTVARVFWDIGIHREPVPYATFERDAQRIIDEQVGGRPLQEIEIGAAVGAILDAALQHKIQAPPDYTMFFKALLTAEGLSRQLAPDVDPVEAARPYVEEMIRERYDPRNLKDEALMLALEFRDVLRRAPILLGQISRDALEGRFRIPLELRHDPEEKIWFSRQVGRLSSSIVAASALVAAALTVPPEGFPLLGPVGTPLLFLALGLAALRGLTPKKD